MSELDYSHLGTLGYADALGGLSSDITEIMRNRQKAKQHADEMAYKNNELTRKSIDDANDAQLKMRHMQNEELKLGDDRQHHDRTDAQAALARILPHIASGDLASARAEAAAAGLPTTDSNSMGAPPTAPIEPQAPAPVDRPQEAPLPGPFSMLPPEVRAILSRGAQAGNTAAAQPRPADAVDPASPEPQRPQVPTEPLPVGADAVDQELAKSHTEEMAQYEAEMKARASGIQSFKDWNGRVEGASYAGARQQGQEEQRAANENATFGHQQEQYKTDQAAFPERQREYQDHAGLRIGLPGNTFAELNQHDVRYAPRQRDAADFRRSQIEPLQAQLQTARDMPTIMRLRNQIADAEKIAASVESGAEKLGTAGAALQKQDLFGAKENNLDSRLDKTLANRTENARIAAAAAAARNEPGVDTKERAADKADAVFARDSAEHFQKGVVGLVPKDLASSNDLLSALPRLHGNAVEQKAALYSIGRKINGPGVFTNQDRNDILNYGGLGARVENALSQMEDGSLSEEYADVAAKAVAHQIEVVNDRVKHARAAWHLAFDHDPDLQTPEMKARMAAHENGLFGAWGQAPVEVPEVPPNSSVMSGSRRRAAARAANPAPAAAPTKPNSAKSLLDENGF